MGSENVKRRLSTNSINGLSQFNLCIAQKKYKIKQAPRPSAIELVFGILFGKFSKSSVIVF